MNSLYECNEMKKLILSIFVCYELHILSFVAAYSKVSKNGQVRASSDDITITVSPVYGDTSAIELKSGEAVNHPSVVKYSTINKELLTKLDRLESRNKLQERFHPPASFEHAHSNGLKQQTSNSVSINSSSNDVIYSKPIISMIYDYPLNIDAKVNPVATKPLSSNHSFSLYTQTKFPVTYSFGSNNKFPTHFSEFDSKLPSFDFDRPPKSVDFPTHYDLHYEDFSTYVQDSHHNDEIIYEYIPNDHFFQHHRHYPSKTTDEPEMMDQRVNKRPYSYYYIGKKLWYIPLYFSIYFIIYVAALVLKSISTHKINFPINLAAVAGNARSTNLDDWHSTGWINYVTKILESIEKYGKIS